MAHLVSILPVGKGRHNNVMLSLTTWIERKHHDPLS